MTPLERAREHHRYGCHLIDVARQAALGYRTGTVSRSHPRAFTAMAAEQLELAARALVEQAGA